MDGKKSLYGIRISSSSDFSILNLKKKKREQIQQNFYSEVIHRPRMHAFLPILI